MRVWADARLGGQATTDQLTRRTRIEGWLL